MTNSFEKYFKEIIVDELEREVDTPFGRGEMLGIIDDAVNAEKCLPEFRGDAEGAIAAAFFVRRAAFRIRVDGPHNYEEDDIDVFLAKHMTYSQYLAVQRCVKVRLSRVKEEWKGAFNRMPA